MDQTQYLREQAKLTVEKMVKDIQDGDGNAAEYIKWLLQDYFKPLYVAKGANGLREGLEMYIGFMENEEATTKKDYIDKLVLKIQQEVDKEEFDNMIADPMNNEMPIEYGVNYNEEILTELENWSWETPDMRSIVTLYEENIKEEFELLKHYQKDQEKIEHLKNQVLNRLASTIVDWSHIKFEQPRNNERSVQIYASSRNEALRFLLNGYTVHNSLHKKIKKLDKWGKISVLEDDQTVVAGICDEANNNIDANDDCVL
ncbi:hypothetical protein G6F36_014246 [Rhizopus arrhizus]|nr:hypothetical protein G6F36_014246 [Rhizopus arrhizus]